MTNPQTDDPIATLERLLKERDEAKAEYHLAIKKPFQSGVLWWTSKQRYEKADAVLTKHLRNLAPALVEVAKAARALKDPDHPDVITPAQLNAVFAALRALEVKP